MIELVSLTKSYNKGQIKAVDDLTLTVEPGGDLRLLDPNGAGKTTTIKMMVGVLAPDKGQVKIAGIDRRKPPGCQKEAGLRAGQSRFVPADHRRRISCFFGRRLRGAPRGKTGAHRKARRNLQLDSSPS